MAHNDAAAVAAALREFVKAGPGTDVFTLSCATEAVELCDNFVAGVPADTVPDVAMNDCLLRVASALYDRQTSRQGVVAFGGADDPQPFRVSADPLTAAYPIFRRYIPAMGL